MPLKKMGNPYELSEYRYRVLMKVAGLGALTTRRLVRDLGPRVTWYPLIEGGYLKAVQTMYGEVVGLTDDAYTFFHQKGHLSALPEEDHLPYLRAPSSMADRAFQNDALERLSREGYRIQRIKFKKATGVSRGGETSQIVKVTLRLPPEVASLIGEEHGRIEPFDWSKDIFTQRGYPDFYGTIANGGIKASHLRQLLKKDEFAPSTWRHPFVIALPEDHELRGTLRRIADEFRDLETGASGLWTDWDYIEARGRVPRFRILTLPRA